MIYKTLAKYYDALLYDEEAFNMWYQFYLKHHKKGSTLELASGTGEISLKIANNNFLDVSDISNEMLDVLKSKDVNKTINSYLDLDLNDLKIEDKYDNIICFCDSINYILDYKTLENSFKNIYNSLNDKGVFMFDMHTYERLDEFKEGYIEVGNIYETDYQWSIYSEEEYINYHFIFYEENTLSEYHTQRVFKLDKVLDILKSLNFDVSVNVDFIKEVNEVGEKYFIVGRKK